MRIADLVKQFQLKVHAATDDWEKLDVQSVAPIDKALKGQLSFFTNPAYRGMLRHSPATALLVRDVVDDFPGVQLLHKDPQFVYAKVALSFYKPDHGPEGVQAGAFIHATAHLGKGVRIHAGAHIDEGASIGDHVVLYPGVYVGRNAQIGEGSVLHPQVVIYQGCIVGKHCLIHAGAVIGADGFGFAVSQGEICKIPQVGIVRIGDHVELGALCTIDRAAFEETVIGNHVKFDDHVHVGHNCQIGDNSMFSAQVGIAGTTKIGRWVLMGGQSGVADHLSVTDGVRIGAKTAVVTSLPERDTYVGFPAIPQSDWLRQTVYLKRLKEFNQTIKNMEKKLAAMEARLNESTGA